MFPNESMTLFSFHQDIPRKDKEYNNYTFDDMKNCYQSYKLKTNQIRFELSSIYHVNNSVSNKIT